VILTVTFIMGMIVHLLVVQYTVNIVLETGSA